MFFCWNSLFGQKKKKNVIRPTWAGPDNNRFIFIILLSSTRLFPCAAAAKATLKPFYWGFQRLFVTMVSFISRIRSEIVSSIFFFNFYIFRSLFSVTIVYKIYQWSTIYMPMVFWMKIVFLLCVWNRCFKTILICWILLLNWRRESTSLSVLFNHQIRSSWYKNVLLIVIIWNRSSYLKHFVCFNYLL